MPTETLHDTAVYWPSVVS